MEILVVISVDKAFDRNRKVYTKLRLTTPPSKMVVIDGKTKKVFVKPKVTTLIAYPISYLPSGAPEFGHDLKLGDRIAGRIVTRRVAPYDIGERAVDTASVIVAGDTNDPEEFQIEIERAFKRNGFTIMTKELHSLLNASAEFSQEKPLPSDCIVHK